jgi:hypothetical protein
MTVSAELATSRSSGSTGVSCGEDQAADDAAAADCARMQRTTRPAPRSTAGGLSLWQPAFANRQPGRRAWNGLEALAFARAMQVGGQEPPRVGVTGVADQLARRAGLDEFAGVHDGQPIGNLGCHAGIPNPGNDRFCLDNFALYVQFV